MRTILLTVLLICGTPVLADEALPFERIVHIDPITGFAFPEMISAYSFVRVSDTGARRLGYSAHYVEITGTRASVIVYDMDLNDIKDGTGDPRIVEEIKKIDEGMAAMVEEGSYESFQRIDNLPQLSKAWLQVNHEITLPNGALLKSYSFIRGQKGKFVKIRISGQSEGSYARLPSFLIGVSRMIGMMQTKP